jgi:aminopeptidase N
MREPTPRTIHLKDYSPPAFLIPDVELDVDIREDHARVRARLQVKRNAPGRGPRLLDGDELELLSITLDGKTPRHEAAADKLTVHDVPDAFELETVTRIVPQKNTKLEGLYATKHGFVTQCEAEGFRRITWFVDRPDNMARFVVTVRADKARFPVLLSNGNCTGAGDEPGNRHWARFDDPFLKPSYLFALVAANLEERKRTRSFIEQRVGPSEAAPHGLWNEGGHKVLRTSGGRVLGTVPPNPFLGPAYRQHRNKVRKALRDRFKSLIDGFRP